MSRVSYSQGKSLQKKAQFLYNKLSKTCYSAQDSRKLKQDLNNLGFDLASFNREMALAFDKDNNLYQIYFTFCKPKYIEVSSVHPQFSIGSSLNLFGEILN